MCTTAAAWQRRCRIQIQLKGITADKTEVYLLNDNIDFPKGLFLGSMAVHDHMAGKVFGCSADHVNGTEYAISQIRGIYIVTGEDTFVASQWDDQETRWKNFRPWEAKTEDSETSEGNTLEEVENIVSFTENKPKAEKVSVLTEGKPKAENEMNSSENKNEESKEDRIKNEREDMPNATSVEPKELQATQQTATVSEKNISVTVGMGKLLSAWENQWERFTATHTLFCPFDEDDGVYGVKLQLQDFKVLPTKHVTASGSSHPDPDSEGIERTCIRIIPFARLSGSLIQIEHNRQSGHKEKEKQDNKKKK